MTDPSYVRLRTPAGRWVLAATVIGSGMSFLDGLIVNIALPKIDHDIHLGVSGLQWVVSGYLLSISALILLGGALGDLYGRRRIYIVGLVIFTIASMGCGLAPTTFWLIIARIVQGIGGALMVPASLAIIQSVFDPEDRGQAIGTWTGLSTIFTGLGPFVGGVFVTYTSWRWAFFINVPLGVISYFVSMRHVPEHRGNANTRVDFVGAILCAIGLGALTYFGIAIGSASHGNTPTITAVVGIICIAAFIAWEAHTPHPMMPLSLFKSRQFSWVNVCTIIFYGAFVGGITFLQVQLQVGLHYTPLGAALASLPVSVMMFFLSGRFGALSQRVGPKIPMTVGPLLVSVALVGMAQIHDGSTYLTFVLPRILIWGLGLSMIVAPLTSAALACAPQDFVGVASAINNAASRVGQALAIAALPALAHISSSASLGGADFQRGYPRALHISAALCLSSAVIALLFIRKNAKGLKS